MGTRGRATIVMGKNTMMKKVIAGLLSEFPEYEAVQNRLVENVGFVFTNEDLKTIRDVVLENKIAAPARAGAIAPVSVTVPAQNTGWDPRRLLSSKLCLSKPKSLEVLLRSF